MQSLDHEDPVGANGERLPVPEAIVTEQAYAAPRTPLEEQLCRLWSAVSLVDRVGIYDDFFQIGGDSLAAVHLLSRMCKAFSVDVPFRRFLAGPTVAGMASWLEEVLQGVPKAPSIPTRGSGSVRALSFVQERIWSANQILNVPSLYNCPVFLRLTGVLDVPVLEAGLNEIVRRHEVLRSRFCVADGRPGLAPDREWHIRLEAEDLRMLPEQERATETECRAVAALRMPFDLIQGPLLGASLLRTGDREHVLLLVFHHSIFDGLSVEILFRELCALYEAFAAGRPSPLPGLPIQYADFASWQRNQWHGTAMEKTRSYWINQLAGPLPLLALPTTYERPAEQSLKAQRISFPLPGELGAGLRALGRREGATLFMVMLASFQVLLARYTGQEDLLIGTPADGRIHAETEGMIGCFVNTLVLRMNLAGNPEFTAWLRQVRQTALNAYSHRDMPFEKLMEEIRPDRGLSRASLFQTVMQFRNGPGRHAEIAGLKLEEFEVAAGMSRLDLMLVITDRPGGLVCTFEYSCDLFDSPAIERMADHYRTLLEAVVQNPYRRIQELPILTEAERRRVVYEWNATERNYPGDRCVHRLVEEMAAAHPEQTALEHAGRRISFRELNRRANQLSRYLVERRDAGPGSILAVSLGRTPEMVIAILAALKTGAAFLPMDPNTVQDRMRTLLRDANVQTVITWDRLAARFESLGIRTTRIDAEGPSISREDASDPAADLTPESPAYVIYTSGSTGVPKGALISHRSLVNYALAAIEKYGLSRCDRRMQFSSVDADFFISEVFTLLLSGGTLVFHDGEGFASLREYLQALKAQRVTLAAMPSAYWHEWVDSMTDEELAPPPTLRLVISGMDRARPDRLRAWQDKVGDRVKWLNAYGPTETTCASAYYQAGGPVPCHFASVPIGKPIANTRIYILDHHMNPVPIGVSGEICIGGDGVALGYLRNPELTAEKFIPDPFRSAEGARIYRTGDLGRFLPDGNIEFLGRIDLQVKIRGYRIELEEIEKVLVQHPAIRAAAVTAQEEGATEKILVAHLVAGRTPPPGSGELRAFLRQKLPEPMVPSRFGFLDTLPMTAGGKVDRQNLARLYVARDDINGSYVPPCTSMETVLAQIWCEALQVDRVGILDNFFDFGGHSLLAMQVTARLEKKLGIRMHPREMILQTLGQQALSCEQRLTRSRRGRRRTSLANIIRGKQ
jgi:amino acid adenylation domain-containing protein